MIIVGYLGELLVKVQTWESGMGKKYLFVNMVLVSSTNLDLLKKSQKDSCAVCLKEMLIMQCLLPAVDAEVQ